MWESWHGTESGEPLLTARLITTDANGTVSPFHDRMPVILPADSIADWLNLATPTDRLTALLAPAPDNLLEAVAVSKLVNSPKNDGPECITPAGAELEK